jgi:small membrane protein
MIAIKIVLIMAIIGMFWAFRNRSRVGLRAGARLAVLLLAVLAAVSIIQPSVAQRAADELGVTRGTDLLLYLLVMVFAASSLGFYFRFRELERRLADLTRAQAIREAVSVQGMPRGGVSAPVQPGPRSAAPRSSSHL